MSHHRKLAFTLVELLVVIAIIAILIAASMPAINSMRDAARRTQCTANVSRLITAVHNYEMAHETYPTGVENDSGPVLNEPSGFHHGWIQSLLPYLDEKTVAAGIDREVGVYDERNRTARATSIPVLTCPTAPVEQRFPGLSCYAGVHHDIESPIDEGDHGVFFLNSRLRYEDVADGTAHTLFLGEKFMGKGRDLGWMSGTRATLRNTGHSIRMTDKTWPKPGPGMDSFDSDPTADETRWTEREEYVELGDEDPKEERTEPGEPAIDDQPASADLDEPEVPSETDDPRFVGGFGSHHSGGAIFAFGDGRVEFVPVSIDQTVYQQMGNRADGAPIGR